MKPRTTTTKKKMERERGNKGGREGGAIRREGHGKREEEG